MKSRKGFSEVRHDAIAILFLVPLVVCGTGSGKVPVIAEWGRLEQVFKSSVLYSNPLQEAALTVAFISPSGETNSVDGFWDGGKTWRARFSPGQPGRWSFISTCSDS